MLVRVLIIGEFPAASSVEDLLPIDVAAEHRDAETFWSDPAESAFDLAILAATALPDDPATAIARLRALPQRPEVAVLGSGISDRQRLELLAAGCYAIVPTGLADGQLARAVAKLVHRRREALVERTEQLPRPRSIDDLISKSETTREVLRIARRVARTDTSLLLLGDTGTGKEWLARAVHGESDRAAGPFIAVNCGAIPENLLESELFGHEKGAFTGAVRARRGYFEQAHGGTLFLDEIGEMPAHPQVRLLRALQDRTIQRLGSERLIEVDVRVIAATQRDLGEEIARGCFRQDLYYRLAVVTLTLPPLRERREDIAPLAAFYLPQYTRKLARPEVAGLSAAALSALTNYGWPGNVRELINVVERSVLLCDGPEIELGDLPREIACCAAGKDPGGKTCPGDETAEPWLDQPLHVGRRAVVAEFERRYLERLLERHQGQIGETAKHAGVDPRTLYNMMRRLGLRKESFHRPRR